ncbi:MAG: sigma-54 interaction domain-containing protein [Nitrospiria bacterium]
MLNILLAVQDPHLFVRSLKGHHVDLCEDPTTLQALTTKNSYHIVLLEDAFDTITAVKSIDPRMEVLYLGRPEEAALGAIQQGAAAFFRHPVSEQGLQQAVEKIAHNVSVRKETARLESQLADKYTVHGITSRNPAMLDIFSFLRHIAPYYRMVLITGETGTGKEVIAKALHASSPAAERPFVTANCGGWVESLIESELFGHTKGAFTGADRDKAGLFETAGDGALFLDEIGELPLSFQAHLLRVLQNGEYRKLGSQTVAKARCRIIAATHRPLEDEVKAGHFREDLYFRITPLVIKVPPLRDRMDDLLLLARVILNRFNQRTGKRVNGISRPAQTALMAYDWPGNIRELENTIERAAMLTTESFIRAEDFPKHLTAHPETEAPPPLSLADAEKNHIKHILDLKQGNRTHASAVLGISRRALIRKIEKYGL